MCASRGWLHLLVTKCVVRSRGFQFSRRVLVCACVCLRVLACACVCFVCASCVPQASAVAWPLSVVGIAAVAWSHQTLIANFHQESQEMKTMLGQWSLDDHKGKPHAKLMETSPVTACPPREQGWTSCSRMWSTSYRNSTKKQASCDGSPERLATEGQRAERFAIATGRRPTRRT